MKALISVSDKTGIVELAKEFAEMGIELISTGGTEATLKAAGLTVRNVSDVTGFPECLDGRVKTLHPHVHAALLAKRYNSEHMNLLKQLSIQPIDIVVVNLYPFKQTIEKADCTLEDAIENIDIGGPAILRSAAKNYGDVLVVVESADYGLLVDSLKEGEVPDKIRFYLASKVFSYTANYDCLIAEYLRKKAGRERFPQKLTVTYNLVEKLRYGENPHQNSAFYVENFPSSGSLAKAVQVSGKRLSFNNITDASEALLLIKEFDAPTIASIKHGNPCGVASAKTISEAFALAHKADTLSIFGGIIASNRKIDEECALAISKIFIEIIIAPSFSDKALDILKARRQLRVLELPDISKKRDDSELDYKKVSGGLLVQSVDNVLFDENEFTYPTQRVPTKDEMANMIFAYKVVKFIKSNGVVIAKGAKTVGISAGQPNRIWAANQAIEHAETFWSSEELKGAALASEAFFPQPDCVKACADAGITAIMQPGGSVNDRLSIEECDKYGIAMVFTWVRHFRH